MFVKSFSSKGIFKKKSFPDVLIKMRVVKNGLYRESLEKLTLLVPTMYYFIIPNIDIYSYLYWQYHHNKTGSLSAKEK